MAKVTVTDLYKDDMPSGFAKEARRLVEKVWSKEGTEGSGQGAEVGITFVDDKFIRKLNKKFRGLDRATDVLSFEMKEGGELGDIVISVDSAQRNAKRYKVPLRGELRRLVVHGLLHLLGLDHVRGSDRAMMRRKEESYLC